MYFLVLKKKKSETESGKTSFLFNWWEHTRELEIFPATVNTNSATAH